MDNLANQPPTIFTTTGSGSLFDIATPSSPYNWIKSEEKMGIIRGVIHDISQNLQNQAKYLEYGKAQFQGTSNATTIDNNGQPLGTRYFVSASGKKCMTIPDNKIVDQYYVIDGMAGQTKTTNGLAFSAAATLGNIDPQNITPFFVGNKGDDSISFKSPENDIDYNTCKKIIITTDGYGNTDSNYVSKNDADKLIANGIAKEAFQNHPFHVHNNREQVRHHIVYGHNPSNWTNITDFGGYVVGADIADEFYFHNQNIAMDNHHIPSIHTSYATIEDPTDDEYNRARQWLKDHNTQPLQKERNVVTGFFLGSMTVIGLFIVFRLLDRSAASRFR